jgi:hypothetical protein
VTSGEQEALKDIPHLKRHLEDLVALSARAFSPHPTFDPDNHLNFMALTFAVKQSEHARSVLALDQSVDAILITRSMFEGLSQLLWAAQVPQERPLRWRSFALVLDWRRIRKQLAAGEVVPEDRQAAIVEGLKDHGKYFLTPKALEAQTRGLPPPDDPYTKNWYGEREKEVFSAVGADRIYDQIYGLFSEWHHWRPAAFGYLLQFEQERTTFVISTRNPSFTAMALAGAFQCLWQTLSFLENSLLGRIRSDLDGLHESYVAIQNPASS